MDNRSVCLINDSFPPEIDGVANAVTNYAGIISREHGQATVVTPEYPGADDSVYNFPVLRYPSIDLTAYVGYRAGLPFTPEMQRELERRPFDIIHSHCPVTSTMLARGLRDRIDAPIVMTYHTKFDIDIANAIRSRLLQEEAKSLLAANISACDEVWTVSRGAGENLRSLGYKGEYIVMPNGVDLPYGRVSEEEISAAAGAYDLPEELPCFLFVGRMMWYKGIRIILEGLKLLKEGGEDFRMVFIGGGGDREEIIAFSGELGLSDKVFFLPPIHDRELIRAWYCRADMFLFPSTFDTNGLVVREAAACSLGSVLVRGSCAAEDVTEGINGLFIDENAESLAAVLKELCRNKGLMKRIGDAAGRQLYMSWESSVKNAWERYGVVIDKYRGGEYPRHEGLSDEFIHAIALAMEAYNQSRDRQLRRRREIIGGYAALKAELSREYTELRGELLEEQEKIRQERLRLHDMLAEELSQIRDRFM